MTEKSCFENFVKQPEKYLSLSLRKKCPYSELFWSVYSRIRIESGEIWSISPYSVRMWENTDQNKSEYGHFSRSVWAVLESFFGDIVDAEMQFH